MDPDDCRQLCSVMAIVLLFQDDEQQGGDMAGDTTPLHTLLDSLTKVNNSRERASRLFQWFIHPIPSKSFFR